MPFFEKTTGTVTISGSPMTDVQGNMHHNDHSEHVTNNGSHNTTTHNAKNSNNHSSRIGRDNGNAYTTYTDERFFSGPTRANFCDETPPPRTTSSVYAQPQNIREEFHDYGHPNHTTCPQQRPTFGSPQNPWQGEYAPTGSMRRDDQGSAQFYRYPARTEMRHQMYANAGYAPQGNHRMENDSRHEYNPQFPYPAQPPKNPFHPSAQQKSSSFYPSNAVPASNPPMREPGFWPPQA